MSALLSGSAGRASAADLTDPDAAVASGREALADQWDVPWYDAETDGYRPLDLTPQEEWDLSWLEWFFNLFTGWNFDLSGLLKLLAWIAVLLVLGWVVYRLIKYYQTLELQSAQYVDESQDGRSHVERVEALPVPLERRVTDLLAEARRLAAAGDLSLAIVYLYGHQLVTLDRGRLLRLVRGKTNRQYLAELRRSTGGRPKIAELFRPTMLLFEEAFFGARRPSRASFDQCLADTEQLVVLADQISEESP